jgi:hypothetical protein
VRSDINHYEIGIVRLPRSSEPPERGDEHVLSNPDHVGAVLTGPHDPVDGTALRIVASDDLVGLGREVELAVHEIEAMRRVQCTEIEGASA